MLYKVDRVEGIRESLSQSHAPVVVVVVEDYRLGGVGGGGPGPEATHAGITLGLHAESAFYSFSDVEDDVQSLQEFSTDLIVEGTARFLKTIKSDVDLPHKLPPGMSARFRIGTSLADAVKVRRDVFAFILNKCST